MASLVERKRRNGVAYQVRWRQDGAWQSDTFGTKRRALRFQCDVEDAGNRGPAGWVAGYGYSAEPTPDASAEASFSEVASRYLLTRTSVSSYQLARYRAMAERMAEVFPSIADVDDEANATWVRDCQSRGVAAKTIANYHGLLHGICAHAVRKGLLPANPCALTRLPGSPPSTPRASRLPASWSLRSVQSSNGPIARLVGGVGERDPGGPALEEQDVWWWAAQLSVPPNLNRSRSDSRKTGKT